MFRLKRKHWLHRFHALRSFELVLRHPVQLHSPTRPHLDVQVFFMNCHSRCLCSAQKFGKCKHTHLTLSGSCVVFQPCTLTLHTCILRESVLFAWFVEDMVYFLQTDDLSNELDAVRKLLKSVQLEHQHGVLARRKLENDVRVARSMQEVRHSGRILNPACFCDPTLFIDSDTATCHMPAKCPLFYNLIQTTGVPQ